MKKYLSLMLVVLLAVSLMTVGCGSKTEVEKPAAPVEEKAPVKVGFIYVGPVGDGGWSYAHNEGRLFL